jgi:hypothetical protein
MKTNYQIGNRIFWKSHEDVKGNGSGIVIDVYPSIYRKGETCYTAKTDDNKIVALEEKDLR